MDYINLKEERRHGDSMLPIKSYEGSAKAGTTLVNAHWHNEMEFFMCVKGTMSIQCGDNTMIAEPGQVMFFNSGVIHAAEAKDDFGDECAFRSVVFSPDMIADIDLIRAKYISPILSHKLILPVFAPETRIEGLYESLYKALNQKTSGSEIYARGILCVIFGMYVQNAVQAESDSQFANISVGVKQAIEYVSVNYKAPISLSELAEVAGMSEGHFCRVFKQYTFKTPVQYINNIRIEKACELLKETDRKVLDIALDTGFNSLSYFISVFREGMGVTPAKFRKTK